MESGMAYRMSKGKTDKTGKIARPTERPRGGRARSVSEMLPDIGGAAFRRFGFIQSSVVSRWHEIVGERYAQVSVPESIRFPHGKKSEGTLTLTISGAHAPMMQHLLPVIIERVNRFFGYAAVSRVNMIQGDIAKSAATPARPELQPVPQELGESLRGVSDPELRAVLEALAGGLSVDNPPAIGKIS
jgi:hypothetical protein